MFCPACGADNRDPGQRYCGECGAALPVAGTPQPLAHRPSAVRDLTRMAMGTRTSALLGPGLKNKLVVGGVGVVALVAVIYVAIQMIVGIITSLLIPLALVLALGVVGYVYLRGRLRR